MNDLGNGVFHAESPEELERAQAMIENLTTEHRARLTAENPDYPWYTDVVFLIHDFASMSNMLQASEDTEDIGIVLSETCQKMIPELLFYIFKDKQVVQDLLTRMSNDAMSLDAIFSKQFGTNQSQQAH